MAPKIIGLRSATGFHAYESPNENVIYFHWTLKVVLDFKNFLAPTPLLNRKPTLCLLSEGKGLLYKSTVIEVLSDSDWRLSQ